MLSVAFFASSIRFRPVRFICVVLATLSITATADIAAAESTNKAPRNIVPGKSTVRGSPIRLRSDKNVGNVLVAVNKSQIIDVDRSFSEITIGNPKIADVIPLSKRSVYVFGKKLGTTSLTLSGAGGAVIAVVDLTVSFDIGALKSQIFDLVPGQKIEVRPAADGLVLSGQVGSATQMERVLAIARRHAGENVTNLIAVTGSQQVMLQLHFAEVDRRQAKLFGISTDLLYQNGNDLINIGTGDGVSTDPESFGSSLITLVSGDFSGTFLLDFLEEKGALRTLAEPNLIALSGDTARFLAGGEFPIPVGQDFDGGRRDITIEFKEFGISLSFTPTVLADGLINLELFSEVSQIDPDNSIQLENLVIPGLEVRRAKTTVEVGNGQAFAIAGLLRENFKDDVRQIPLLGDLPVLGALFRSAAYQSGLTELVIVVTPYLVQPTTPAQLASPNDSFIAPNAEELFLLGRTEGQPRQPVKSESEDSSAELHRTLVGGIVGPHGYILR